MSVTLAIAWELVNGDDGGGPPVGVYGKVAARNEDGVPMCLINTSMATYITTYKGINTKLIGLGCPAQPREDQTWNYTYHIGYLTVVAP